METCCQKSNQTGTKSGKRLKPFHPIFLFCILPVRFYRYFISPMLGSNCRFEPTCSSYAEQSFAQFGFFKGLFLTLRRIGKCHPWNPGGYDPVPTCSSRKKSTPEQTDI